MSDDELATIRWALSRLREGAAQPTPRARGRFVAPEWRNPDSLLANFGLWKRRIGAFEERDVARAPDGALEVTLRDCRDRTWLLRLRTDARGRLSAASLRRPLPPGISIRPAGAQDWKALAELERCCPTRASDGSLASIDRGDKLRPHFELQGEYTIWLAECEGRIVGARAFTVRQARIEGIPRRLCYSHFVRVLPAYQSMGLFQILNAMALETLQTTTDGMFAYMDPRNDAMRAAIGGAEDANDWTVRPRRLVIRCGDHALAGRARRARPEDAERVSALVNACHAAEGFFSPYTPEFLAARFARAPRAYSWSDLLIGERAVMGTWLAGERRRVEGSGGARESVRGLVLDYGFEGRAGLEELVDLLRQWCASARQAGMTHLTLFSSQPSPGWEQLSMLADAVEGFEFTCTLPALADVEERGLFVDPIYF